MAHAYTPGLTVSRQCEVVRVRELPLPGKTLVKKGDTVTASQDVLSAELPGDLDIIRVADRMGLDVDAIKNGMRVGEGDVVEKGKLICEVKTFFGLFTVKLESPLEGVVEFFTEANGHLGIRQASKPITVGAYINGKVTDVVEGRSVTIETTAALVQGIFGVGGERLGSISVLPLPVDKIVSVDDIRTHVPDLKNRIIVGGASFTIDALRHCVGAGATGIMTGSIESDVLRQFVGHDIGVSVTGDENISCTLIITEGFGELPISPRIVDLARDLQGMPASINGATQVRAGAVRPELIITTSGTKHATAPSNQQASHALDINSRVRLIRVPYFGQFATVMELQREPQVIETGAAVRVLKVKLDSGESVTVPRANVELI